MNNANRPAIRLAYVLELVAALGAAFAMIRLYADSHDQPGDLRSIGNRFRWLAGSLMVSLAAIEGSILLIQRACKKGPPTWGWGRWVWSVTSLSVLWEFATGVVVNIRALGRTLDDLPSVLATRACDSVDIFSGSSATFMIMGLISIRLAGWSIRDPKPDAREWAGRAFAIFSLPYIIIYYYFYVELI